MSVATHSKLTRSVGSPAYSPFIAGPALREWPQGEPGLWCGCSECVSSEWCVGCEADAECETLSEWSPKAAASESQHGNNAVLSQNTTQANTKATRAGRRRPRGRLVSGTRVILRVNENVFVKLHLCQEELTAMRMPVLHGKTPWFRTLPHIICLLHESGI